MQIKLQAIRRATIHSISLRRPAGQRVKIALSALGALLLIIGASSMAFAQEATPIPSPSPSPSPQQQVNPPSTTGQPAINAPAAVLPLAPPPIAPDYQAPIRPLPPSDRVGVDVTEQFPFTLNDAIRAALKNSNDIDASRMDVVSAENDLMAARGVYDPVLATEGTFERRTTPTSSTIGGATNGAVTQTDATGLLSLGGFTPFAGGSYAFEFSSTRLSTNSQNATLNPQFPSLATLSYTQPLLRGLRFDENRRQIEIAKKNLSLTDAQFRARVIDVIATVEQAYWDLVFALRNLQVQIDAVKQARAQVESNNRLVDKGVLAPIDVVAAETQVTTFEQNVYLAQEAVTRSENILKILVLPDRSSPIWSRAITPVTPVDLQPPHVPLEQAVKAALDNRPELAQLRTTADINKIDVRFLRDQTKPQVDLIGAYSTAGLAGAVVPRTSTIRTDPVVFDRVNALSTLAGLPPILASASSSVVPDNLIGGYGQSLRNLFAQTYPTASVGVRISLPLMNRTAEGRLGSALAQGNKINDQIRQFEQLIEADVRNTLQTVRSTEARLAAAAATRESAQLQYESEQRRFRAGTTTVFLVLQRQTDLLSAQARELQAQTDLNKAIASFQRATGNTLASNNIALRSEPGARPEPRDGQTAQSSQSVLGSQGGTEQNSNSTTSPVLTGTLPKQ